MQTGEAVSVERVFVSPHAGERQFHVVKTAVHDADGSIIGV